MSHLLLELSCKKKSCRDSVVLQKNANQKKTRIVAYFQQFEKAYPFQNFLYRKPTCDIYVLQSLQGQLLGFHSLIAFLNPDRDLICLKTGGISFHILGSMKETDSKNCGKLRCIT